MAVMTAAFAVVGRIALAGLAISLGWCWVVNRQLTAAERLAR